MFEKLILRFMEFSTKRYMARQKISIDKALDILIKNGIEAHHHSFPSDITDNRELYDALLYLRSLGYIFNHENGGLGGMISKATTASEVLAIDRRAKFKIVRPE